MDHPPTLATAAGTTRFAQRFPHLAPDHFRARYGLILSSIGLALAPQPGRSTSAATYAAPLSTAVEQGCNLLDLGGGHASPGDQTALGQALAQVFGSGEVQRDEVLLCSRAGLVAAPHAAPEVALGQVQETREALHLDAMAIAGGHCMEPAFLGQQLATRLETFGLEGLDVFYLDGPDIQLAYITRDEFRRRLARAFTCLEEECSRGRIRFYGVAGGTGLLASPTAPQHLPLPLLVETARQVGGAKHHFRFLQFPYNLGELEPVVEMNQFFRGVGNGHEERLRLPLLAAARQYALVAVGCRGLMGGGVLEEIPGDVKQDLGAFDSDAQYALYFNRSTPGLTTTLVNTSKAQHMAENLVPARRPALAPERFWGLLRA